MDRSLVVFPSDLCARHEHPGRCAARLDHGQGGIDKLRRKLARILVRQSGEKARWDNQSEDSVAG